MDCTICQNKGCRSFSPCSDNRAEYAVQYETNENQMRTKTASSLIDNGRAGTLTRLDEIVEYCSLQGYRKIGVAYCYGLEKQAEILQKHLKKHGFRLSMVSCTVHGMSETEIDRSKTKQVVSCNPLGQAYILNKEKVDFVILVGLCLGHDVILQNALEADFTTFIVKDRVLNHNPILALNDGKAPEDEFLENLPNNYHILKLDDFRQMLQEPDFLSGAYLLDLRSAEKHAENGIPGSVQCLIRDLPGSYRRLMPDRSKKVIILCGSGQMSMYAVMYLEIKGYREVWSLAGGFNKYAAESKQA